MRRLFAYIVSLCCMALMSYAQTVTSLEYWVDATMTHHTIQAMADNEIAITLDASDLTDGTHSLYYRFQDSEGAWSVPHAWDFYKVRLIAEDDIIVKKLEYWVDAEMAHKTTMDVTNNAASFTLDASDLRTGYHTLYYRFQDNQDEWSVPHAWDFYKVRLIAEDDIIVKKLEYWVDAEMAHKTTMDVTNNAASFTLDASDLRTGYHTLYYRFQDNQDEWSVPHAWDFYKVRLIAGDGIEVQELEYWIDTLVSQRTTTFVAENAASLSLDLSAMRTGYHTLHYRFKDNQNEWSSPHGWDFFVTRIMHNDELKVVECEYWIDEVTPAKKQTIAVTSAQTVLSLNTIGLTYEEHTLFYRFKDNEGEYSPMFTHLFVKVNPYDPVMILDYDVTELNADMLNANPDYRAYPTELEDQMPDIQCNNP